MVVFTSPRFREEMGRSRNIGEARCAAVGLGVSWHGRRGWRVAFGYGGHGTSGSVRVGHDMAGKARTGPVGQALARKVAARQAR